MKTQGEYLLHKGLHCPFCDSEDISASEGMEQDGPTASQRIHCDTCDKQWDDLFTLTGFDDLFDHGAE